MTKREKGEVERIELVEAARLLHVGYQVAHRLALQGTLDARRIDGHWEVTRVSVQRLLRDRAAAAPAPAAT